MLEFKTAEEVELIRNSSLMVSKTLAEIAGALKPGISTQSLDDMAGAFIRDHGGVPAFKGYRGFPGNICTSMNEEVVHGIPGKRELKDGDVFSVDCGVVMEGYYGDSAYTFLVGKVKPEITKLLQITKESLYKGIEQAIQGNRVGDIGFAVQQHNEANGYSVVRELVGHGVGKQLHEEPEVPNYGRKGQGTKLQDGLIIAIEPMINLGKKEVFQATDGWTILTADRSVSAHFEHTVVVRTEKAEILSSFDIIEKAVKNNAEIHEFEAKS